jgi:hypothetical protein
MAASAPALVVERIPKPEFVEVPENIEFVLGRERQRSGMGHPSTIAGSVRRHNQAHG